MARALNRPKLNIHRTKPTSVVLSTKHKPGARLAGGRVVQSPNSMRLAQR